MFHEEEMWSFMGFCGPQAGLTQVDTGGDTRQYEVGIDVVLLSVWEDWDGSVQTLMEGSGDPGCVSLCLCSQYNCSLSQQDPSELRFPWVP